MLKRIEGCSFHKSAFEVGLLTFLRMPRKLVWFFGCVALKVTAACKTKQDWDKKRVFASTTTLLPKVILRDVILIEHCRCHSSLLDHSS